MLQSLFDTLIDLMLRGGVVMWPLLALSLLGLTIVFERAWFWLRTNNPVSLRRLDDMAALLRQGRFDAARALVGRSRSAHARLVLGLIEDPSHPSAAAEAVERQRGRLERFMPTLSTIITAAPMLGILGTVLGLIASFRVLSDAQSIGDPRAVSPAIAEALLTTAAGLAIAIVILFPYNAFRAQIDRTLSRWETLIATVHHSGGLNSGGLNSEGLNSGGPNSGGPDSGGPGGSASSSAAGDGTGIPSHRASKSQEKAPSLDVNTAP